MAADRLALPRIVVAAVLLAGCAGRDAGPEVPLPPVGAPTTAAPATATTGAAGVDAPPAAGPGRTPTTVRRGAPSPRPTAPPPSEPVMTRHLASGPPGSFARTLLRPAPATRLVLEVLVQDGAAPSDGLVAELAAELQRASRKAVTVHGPTALPVDDESHTDDEIRGYADRHAVQRQEGDQAVVRAFFLRGQFAAGRSVLGVAVRGDTMAVFTEQVRRATTPFAGRTVIETAVATHELGHLLGLVDLARDTGRADPEHEGHSTNRGSVMYWAIDSDVVAQVLGGPPPTEFDSADEADLAALRRGA